MNVDNQMGILELENIILKHKDCRTPHVFKQGIVSCLVMVLAEVRAENPFKTLKDIRGT